MQTYETKFLVVSRIVFPGKTWQCALIITWDPKKIVVDIVWFTLKPRLVPIRFHGWGLISSVEVMDEICWSAFTTGVDVIICVSRFWKSRFFILLNVVNNSVIIIYWEWNFIIYYVTSTTVIVIAFKNIFTVVFALLRFCIIVTIIEIVDQHHHRTLNKYDKYISKRSCLDIKKTKTHDSTL